MILIRVDGNEKVGLGHVMRCLSIADALKDNGEEVLFVTADAKCETLLKARSFPHIILHSDYADMDGEIDALCALIEEHQPSAVLVDSYFVTDRYLTALKERVKLIYVDDLLAFSYPVDILINYNIFADAEEYQRLYRDTADVPQIVLGTEYTPLRKEFSQVTPRPQPQIANKVLISTGGADPQHIALSMIRYLARNAEAFADLAFTFIIGGANMDLDEIRELSDGIDQIKIVYNVSEMSKLMCEHNIAVSAAGSTLYELCACGLPTITYVLADNQIPAAKVFSEKGVMIDAGDVRKDADFIQHIFAAVQMLSQNQEQRMNMARAAVCLADGRGAYRLATMITQ